ncbi:MAG: DUF5009 domain-containing protein [Fimbriimonadales bacterium]
MARVESGRSLALDALRGLAIVGMFVSGQIPWDGLPAWMYHAQEPPPTHAHNPNLPGITWVDLVFPFFLFAMGAAIPLAQTRRLAAGRSVPAAVGEAFWRGLLLAAFAIYVQHVRPHTLQAAPDRSTWLQALAAFGLGFPMFLRLPERWPWWVRGAVRAAGWGGAAALLSGRTFADGTGFSLGRSDPILLVLANCAAFGGAVWILTRGSPAWRWGLLAALVAFRVSAEVPGTWIRQAWEWDAVGWLFRPYLLGYLGIVLPGTLVGDLLRQPPTTEDASEPPRLWRRLAALLCWAPVVPALVGLHGRDQAVAWLSVVPGVLLAWAWRRDRSQEVFVAAIGFGLLAVGLLFAPFQGGIKKDPPTISYWLVGGGLAACALAGLQVWERAGAGPIVRSLASVGMNPMLAYLAITNLVVPLWRLTVHPWFNDWEAAYGVGFGLFRTGLQTVLFVALVGVASMRRWWWRA